MSTIDFSPGALVSLNGKIFSQANSGTSNNTSSQAALLMSTSAAATPMGIIFVMKGIVPTDFSTLTSISARSTDILVTYRNVATIGINDFSSSQIGQNPVSITTLYESATQTGTATWLWWMSVTSVTPFATPYYNATATPFTQVIGTIGTSGSGADFIMASTSIVTGTQYRLVNLQVQLPNPWVF
jgi:hypothetical protein